MKGIYVKITGQAHCKWNQGGQSNSNQYVGNEKYLKETTFLVGNDHGKIKYMMLRISCIMRIMPAYNMKT